MPETSGTTTTANGAAGPAHRSGREPIDGLQSATILNSETPGCRFDCREPEAVVMFAPVAQLAGIELDTFEYLIGLLDDSLSDLGDGSDRLASQKVGEALGALKMLARPLSDAEGGPR